MSPDSGPGIPGWFIALAILIGVLSVGTWVWRISVARQIAEDAGLDPDRATAVTMLSKDGVDATYLASALASRSPAPAPVQHPKSPEDRLRELQALKDKGLVSDDEYEAQRQHILGSI
jgi:putative oligomerization/nucleic acid binding protein